MSVTLAVKVTPKSGKDEVVGILENEDGATEVAVRVTAPPDKGKANKAICKLIASEIGLPKSAVSVKRGDTSHHKLLEIDADAAVLDGWISKIPRLF